MSPLSRINAGSFFSGYSFEYSSLGWPGTTVVGTNSILSIRPSSIAAMRTFRANGEAGEKVSFIRGILELKIGRHCEERSDEAIHAYFRGAMDCFASLAMTWLAPRPGATSITPQ